MTIRFPAAVQAAPVTGAGRQEPEDPVKWSSRRRDN